MWFVSTDTPGLSQEKVVVVVAVMAELNDVKLVCVMALVMWCTLPFNKSFLNFTSVKIVS